MIKHRSVICRYCNKLWDQIVDGEVVSAQCPHCGGRKQNRSFYVGTDIYSGYNHGLGEKIYGRKHYNQIMNEKGFVPVGNESSKVKPPQTNYDAETQEAARYINEKYR